MSLEIAAITAAEGGRERVSEELSIISIVVGCFVGTIVGNLISYHYDRWKAKRFGYGHLSGSSWYVRLWHKLIGRHI